MTPACRRVMRLESHIKAGGAPASLLVLQAGINHPRAKPSPPPPPISEPVVGG